MLGELASLARESSNNSDALEALKLKSSSKSKISSQGKENADSKQNSIKSYKIIEDDPSSNNKKSTFGKNKSLADKMIIDFNKKEVNLQNSEDQKALIHILKKEARNKKEINFIDMAVCQLKFFSEKKTQLNEKLYSKLLDKLKYQFIEKEKPLFYHGDKGDKYYIVLQGTLILLIPPKPFEEAGVIDLVQQNKLKERYQRLKDHGQEGILFRHSQVISHFDEDQIIGSPLQTSSRNRASVITNRYINTALKFTSHLNKPQTPTNQSLNDSKNNSTPQSRKQSYRLKATDFDAEKDNNYDNTFELYCQAFFPNCKQAFTFNAGAGFGEIALIRKTERSGTVVSKEDCHLMTLDKQSFDEILGRWEREKTDEQLNFLRSFTFFKDVNDKYLLGFLHSMKQVSMSRNDIVYVEEETPENVYFIKQGEIELSKLCHIQKSETLQQQLDKEEIDTLIRGSNVNQQSSKNKNISIQNQENSKKKKSETKIPIEPIKKERKFIDSDARVKFSVISEPCYFGDEEILLEQSARNHMAKVLSTTAELWVIDRKNFNQLLKQQRTFKIFQDQCITQIELREKRIEKISSTIKKEENKFFVNSYKPKHIQTMRRQTLNNEQSLLRLLKDEEELNSTQDDNNHLNHTQQNFNGNNIYQLKEGQFINNFKDQSYINDDKTQDQTNSSKLMNLFSRNYYLEQLEQVNSKKMKILKEISSRGIGFNNPGQNNQGSQMSMTEIEEEFGQDGGSKKHNIPYQKNLLFQLNTGNGIKRGVYRDPFQTYDDQPSHTAKTLKTTQSFSNLLMGSDKKRNTAHNLCQNPKSMITIKPILDKFEKEQYKSCLNSARQVNPNKGPQFFSATPSITQINEIHDEPPKIRFAPLQLQNSLTKLPTCLSPKNNLDSTLSIQEKVKTKYPNLSEIIQESKYELQTISELDNANIQPNSKRVLKKMKSDIQYENDYHLYKETKQKSHFNSTNVASIQLLHETEDDDGQTPQSKTYKFSSTSLLGNSKQLIKTQGDLNKQLNQEGKNEVKESPYHSNYMHSGKQSRNSIQEIFNSNNNNNPQSQKIVFSTLNLNASENAFDSLKILLTEEGEGEITEEKENGIYTPQHVLTTQSPMNFLKIGNSFSARSSNIHMNKLRSLNQPKHIGSTHFVNTYNKNKTINSKKNLNFTQQSYMTQTPNSTTAATTNDNQFMDLYDASQSFVTKAFKSRTIHNNMYKKIASNKK